MPPSLYALGIQIYIFNLISPMKFKFIYPTIKLNIHQLTDQSMSVLGCLITISNLHVQNEIFSLAQTFSSFFLVNGNSNLPLSLVENLEAVTALSLSHFIVNQQTNPVHKLTMCPYCQQFPRLKWPLILFHPVCC